MTTMYNPEWTALVDLVKAARDILASSEGSSTFYDDLRKAMQELDTNALATEEQVEAAKAVHDPDRSSDTTIESFGAALVSETDDGYWVSATVFVPVEEAPSHE